MNFIDILPEYYWFYKQNGHLEINYEELFFNNQPILGMVYGFFSCFWAFEMFLYRTVEANFDFLKK